MIAVQDYENELKSAIPILSGKFMPNIQSRRAKII